MKVRFWFENSAATGTNQEETVEVADDAPDDEIEEACREWMFNFISYGWHKAEDEG